MTLLSMSGVQSKFNNWCVDFIHSLENIVFAEARKFDYLRIYNDVLGLNFNFKKFFPVAKIYDDGTHSFISGWETNVYEDFINAAKLLGHQLRLSDIKTFIEDNQLQSKSGYDVCHGHDTIALMGKYLVKAEYSTPEIEKRLEEYANKEDFQTTCMYAEIKSWASKEQVDVL